MKCTNCATKLDEEANFCPKCGLKRGEKPTGESNMVLVCSKCGAALKEGKKFCSKCGANASETGVMKPKEETTAAVNNSSEEAYKKGKAFLDIDDYDNAIDWFTEAITRDPQNVNAYIYRGDSYFSIWKNINIDDFEFSDDFEDECKEKKKKMLDNYNMAISFSPNALAYLKRGCYYRYIFENFDKEKDNINKAISDFNKAIKLDPKSSSAYYERALAYRFNNQFDMTISDLTKAIELDPEDANNYIWRGCTYSKIERYDEAISDLTKAIEHGPKNAIGYAWRGYAYKMKNQKDMATKDLEKALNIDPDIKWIKRELSEAKAM